MKLAKFLWLFPILVLPVFAHAKPHPSQDLFKSMVDNSQILTMKCSLKGVTFDKQCKIKANYIGSTMGDAITVYFPNGRKAEYRVANYEKKTLFGLHDDDAKYRFTSTINTIDIYRNEQSWIKLWKTK